MHHEPGGFVDHKQVRIFKNHVQRHRLGHKRHGLLGGAQFHLQQMPHLDAGRGLVHRSPQQPHGTIGHELLQVGTREFGDQAGQRTVDPPAMHLDRDFATTGLGFQQGIVAAGR
ncbi:hypothetical protein Y695_02804 [Hydrogenophaga sp. T4]|nr:hypothetical protein Y695_02804 [Hydrogenophaga sp. T4]